MRKFWREFRDEYARAWRELRDDRNWPSLVLVVLFTPLLTVAYVLARAGELFDDVDGN